MKKTILLLCGVCISLLMHANHAQNNALSFDGNNDIVTATIATTATDNITMEAWVNWNGDNGKNQCIVLNGNSGYSGYAIFLNNANDNKISVLCGSVTIMSTESHLTQSTWQHVAVVRDNGTWSLYLDGNPIALTANSDNTTPFVPVGYFYIGGTQQANENFNGSIDEVRVWNVARTQSQVVFDMTGPTVNPSSNLNLVAYYNFDNGNAGVDNSGVTTLYDLSASGNNASLTNFALTGTTSNWVSGFNYSNIAVSQNTATINSANGSQATIDVATLTNWTASSDQTWLTVPSSTTYGSGTLTLTVAGNGASVARTATVTITDGLTPQTITVTQEGITYTIASKAGMFYTKMTTWEKQNCTKVIVTDTIDARDFVTFRDSMPNLDTLDLSAAKIVAYSGDKGTGQHGTSYSYNENAIPMAAFYNFDISQASQNLKTIVLPNTSTEISGYAFFNSPNLNAITLPATLISIGEGVFIGCTSLYAITIPASVTTMSQYVFVGSGLNFITFEDKSQLTSISYEAFFNCSNLSAIRIPASVDTIVGNAFLGCNSLTSFTFEANSKLKTIDPHLFYNIPITSISIPASVTTISDVAFESCSKLQFITAMSITPIDLSSSSNVFNDVDKASCVLNVPYGSKALYQAANQWKDFNNITEAIILSDTRDALAPVIDKLTSQIMTNSNGQYLKFIPKTTGTYTFSSASSSDPYGELFDVNGNYLTDNDDGYGDNGLQFSFSYTLTAGELYYILLYNCDGDNYAITLNISGGDLLSCKYTGIGNWDEVANWNIGSIPSIYNNVTIDGDVTINQDLSVSSITISPNASLSIDNGIKVKYNNLTLVNDETGSASLISDNTKMPATVSKYLKAGHNSYISSPMTTSKSNVVKVVGTDKLWNYDEKASSWNEITDGTTTLDSTSGYVANKTTDGNIYFSEGALNTGNYSNRLSNSGTNSKSGFNLVGNPYPSYLIWDLVNIANIDSSIWFRKQTAENAYVFDTYNSKTGIGTHNYGGSDVTGIIPPMQAFWVHVKSSPDGIIALNNTMRYNHNAYYALKADANSNDVIRLLVANGKNTDEAIIVFNSNASNGYDAWDSQKMFNESVNVPQIYTTVGDEKVVINGLESTTSNSIIPLGFKTAKAGTFTISATEINGVDVVVLEDKLLNKTQDLTGSASYTFTSDNVDNSNRFAIRLKANSVTDVPNVLESTIVIAAQNQSIVVTTSETTGTINVYDLLGRIVETKAIEGTKTVIESSVGVYFVKVQTATKNETKKLIIE